MDFLILPDRPDAAPAAGVTSDGPSRRIVPHASGRPWIVGNWADEECTLITAGTRMLVLFGRTRVDAGAAARALGGARSPHDLDPLARRLPGSVHLLASIDGRVRAQGSVATTRQIFHARVGGMTLAADTPAPLTALTGAALDNDAVALRLMAPGAPWPLSLRTVWQGVTQLDVASWLDIGADGQDRTVRWWRAPAADIAVQDAAGMLRTVLREAVAVRAEGHDTISADLSGGLDSTSLCFVAADTGSRLLTHHWKPLDPANDDTLWAERAAALLPAAHHRFVRATDGPDWFEDFQDSGATRPADAEGPLLWSRNRARMEQSIQSFAAEGSDIHLMGVGGDELFSVSPGHFWSLVRTAPLQGIPAVNRCRVLNRWGALPTVRGLLDNRSFARTLADADDTLTAPGRRPSAVSLGWITDPRMPPWATPQAADSVRRTVRAVAGDLPDPMDPDRAQHQIMDSLVQCGTGIRQMGSVLSRFGVELAAPFLDDRVIEAALSVRLQDRAVRGEFKPVLTRAMRGVVPDPVLDRRSKGDFSAELYAGLHHNRRALLTLCDDLRLAGLGLVDADVLRAELLSPQPESSRLAPFEHTLACERWLRSVEADRRTPSPVGETL